MLLWCPRFSPVSVADVARGGGIPGLALLLTAGGAYLLYVGMANVPVLEGLRGLLRGQLPPARPRPAAEVPAALQFNTAAPAGDGQTVNASAPGAAGGALGARIAAEGMRHIGVPYRWGGNDPSGWDCSGMVTYVLRKVGVTDLPSTRPTAIQYLTWGGAQRIPREQCAAGDLACWSGHIGIATDRDNMVNAPTFGVTTRVQRIYGGVTIRRINGAAPATVTA